MKFLLRQLMDQVAAANSPEAVGRSALGGLRSILGIERAAVLAYNGQGTMRFIASAGLSPEFRAAVEQGFVWQPDQVVALPVLVGDLRNDRSLVDSLPLLEREGIKALAFVPLRFGSSLLGKLALFYEEPHEFDTDEVAAAETVAGQVAFGIEHHRMAASLEARLAAEHASRQQAEREAALRRKNEQRLQMALAAGQMCAWEWDLASGRIEWSAELEQVFGPDAAGFAATVRSYQRYVHPADLPKVEALEERLRKDRLPHYQIEYRLVPPDGILRWISSKGRVIYGRDGAPVRLVGVCTDVTDRKRMERSKEFLAETSRVLATTLRPEDTVRYLARLVVPSLADWCIIQVVDDTGEIRPVELAHSDPAKVALAWEIANRWQVPSEHGSAMSAVRTGEATLVPEIEHRMLLQRAVNEEHLQALESLGLKSAITVPLKARGRKLGALTLLSAESQRVYDEADLRFAQEIAGWAELAIDNAQLHRQAENERAAAERSREFLHVLAKVGDDLASSLDPDAALKLLASRLVGKVADYCVTWSCDGARISRIGLAHRSAERLPLVEMLCDASPPAVDDDWGAGAVIRTGEAILLQGIGAAMRERCGGQAELIRSVEDLAPHSTVIVPLRARPHAGRDRTGHGRGIATQLRPRRLEARARAGEPRGTAGGQRTAVCPGAIRHPRARRHDRGRIARPPQPAAVDHQRRGRAGTWHTGGQCRKKPADDQARHLAHGPLAAGPAGRIPHRHGPVHCHARAHRCRPPGGRGPDAVRAAGARQIGTARVPRGGRSAADTHRLRPDAAGAVKPAR